MNKHTSHGLCQEATPQNNWPYQRDWIVRRVSLAAGGYSAFYPLWVTGTNLNDGQTFIWNLPLPLSWRYDLENAEYGEGVLQ